MVSEAPLADWLLIYLNSCCPTYPLYTVLINNKFKGQYTYIDYKHI
jgi:hypothetical protein